MMEAAVVATAMNRRQRGPPSLPFGWGTVTVLLIGTALTIIGIVMILGGFFTFITGTVNNATSSDFSIGSFFSSFFGMIILMVVGAMLAGAAGETVADAVARADDANRRGMGAVLNVLGEHYEERATVDAAMDEYFALLDAIHARRMDASLSIKPTQTGVTFDADTYWQNVQ